MRFMRSVLPSVGFFVRCGVLGLVAVFVRCGGDLVGCAWFG